MDHYYYHCISIAMVPKLQNTGENPSKLAQVLFLTIYQICKIILQSSAKNNNETRGTFAAARIILLL